MKQFIVLAAVLPILLVFMMQAAYDQKNSSAVGQIQALVYAAKEDAKQEGCFSAGIKTRLKRELAKSLGISEGEILVEGDEQVKYRYAKGDSRLIRYKVEVPMKEVMAGAGLFRIKEEDNQYRYVIDSYTASERV